MQKSLLKHDSQLSIRHPVEDKKKKQTEKAEMVKKKKKSDNAPPVHSYGVDTSARLLGFCVGGEIAGNLEQIIV